MTSKMMSSHDPAVAGRNGSLLKDVLPRTHPHAFAALMTEAYAAGVNDISVTSCWHPMLGSIVHRAGLGSDVVAIANVHQAVKLNRVGLVTGKPNSNIYFDPNGKTLNRELRFSTFTAKRSSLDRLVLIKEGTDEKPYSIANWDQGIPGDVSFSPAVCVTTDRHRYSNHWKKPDSSGNVGCREWTAQLYQKEPYIDVTTYSKKGNFIGEVVGWARFEDGPTPIIGMQGKQWLCLHECPAGEQPGVIHDMQAWTRKHGFPMPVPPSKQPRYPNKDYEDDLNEFWLD